MSTEFAEWDAFVGASPDGSVYAQSQYLAALGRVPGQPSASWASPRRPRCRRHGCLRDRSGLRGLSAGPRLLLYYHGAHPCPYEGAYPSQRTVARPRGPGRPAGLFAALGYDRMILKSRSTVSDVRAYLDAAGSPPRATPTSWR